MPGIMEAPDPVSMLSTDPLLIEKLSREMTHQNFEPPEQIGTAKMLIDMAAQEAIPAYGFARSGEDMINSLKEGDLGWAALAGAGMLPGIPGITALKKYSLPERTADTMSEAISLSSPSGSMSKRAREAANKRHSEALFGPGGLPTPSGPAQPSYKESLLAKAAELRDIASRGMSTKKYTKEAQRLEAEAEKL